MPEPLLLPKPRELSVTGGTLDLSTLNRTIAINLNPAAPLMFTAQRAQAALKKYANAEWTIAGGDVSNSLRLSVDSKAAKPEGYHLSITAEGIQVVGGDLAGVFYGVCTLVQLLHDYGAALPFLEINDWPDFPARGVMVDISRDKVPTMETIYGMIDLLASWKVNQFQLYMEHTFAYRNHGTVWEKASPFTAEEILALDAYCRERFVDLVPNQNSIGHLHHWFMHEAYLPLAETETGMTTPWGSKQDYPFSLSPAVPETRPFLEELYDELLPNFTSQMFNVGGDETFDLGMGRSKAMVEERGKGRVYLDFLLEIYERVKVRGRTMQFWGDIINQYPDLVPEIPKDTIALEWGYEDVHDFPGKSALFASSGIPFYVCPGTSSWCSIGGRTDNAMANLRNAVENGLKYGAIGVLNTDWGDLGHWQPLPISYLGFAYGAALSWCYEQNREIDLPAALSAFAFDDRAGVMGKLAYDLGNAYQKPGVLLFNGNFLFWIFNSSLDHFVNTRGSGWMKGASREVLEDRSRLIDNLRQTVSYIDQVMAPLDAAEIQREDAEQLMREFAQAAWMMKHGALRALEQMDGSIGKGALMQDFDALLAEYRATWLARNRPGGLSDSEARLMKARETYTT